MECTWTPAGSGVNCPFKNEMEKSNKNGKGAMYEICLVKCRLAKNKKQK